MEKTEKGVSKFAYRFQKESFNALCCNKTGLVLAVGGRNSLKILDISYENEKFSKTRRSFNTTTNYLEWSPLEDNKFGCATLGHVIIFDVSQGSGSKECAKLDMKSQSTLRINFHPTDVNTLCAASNEWSIKIWDIRNDKKPAENLKTFDTIRDLKFVPANPNQIIVAFDNGSLALHDQRKLETPVDENREAHRQVNMVLDFNPNNRELFASGSMDKTIKIWNINNIKKEIQKIQNQQGVGTLKWKPDNQNQLCTASIHKDFTLTLWDIRASKHPEAILRGHKDVVTSCIFEPSNKYVVTCTKDGMLVCHDWRGAYQPMQYANKHCLSMDLDSTVAFSFNHAFSPDKDTKKAEKNIYFVSKLNTFSASNFNTFRDEVKYLAENYKTSDPQNVWELNAQVSKENRMVSSIWKDLPVALKDITGEREHTGINSDTFLKGGRQSGDLGGSSLTKGNSNSSENKDFFKENDLVNLVSYYEKFPEQLKADLIEKRIVYQKGRFFVLPQVRQLAEEHQKEAQKQYELRTNNPKKYRKSVEDSITKTVQEVVNNGDVQSGYYMYLSLKDYIKFPDHMVETWAQAYIEILRIYRFYVESNEIISTSAIQRIHQGNTRSTTFYASCGSCRRAIEDDGRILCNRCKKFISECSICKVPVKGLMLWCQGCGHGGHFKEVKQWFTEHDECPSGCQHKCYAMKI